VGPDAGTTYTISAPNAGFWDHVTFSNFPSVTAGANNDVIRFNNAATLAGSADAGGGSNTADYSLWTTGVTVNLAASTASNVATLFGFRHVLGGQGNDTITGASTGGLLLGGAGKDTLTGGTGRAVLAGGSDDDILKGGTRGDILIAGILNFEFDDLIAIL